MAMGAARWGGAGKQLAKLSLLVTPVLGLARLGPASAIYLGFPCWALLWGPALWNVVYHWRPLPSPISTSRDLQLHDEASSSCAGPAGAGPRLHRRGLQHQRRCGRPAEAQLRR